MQKLCHPKNQVKNMEESIRSCLTMKYLNMSMMEVLTHVSTKSKNLEITFKFFYETFLRILL
jgi:hypothetical protein